MPKNNSDSTIKFLIYVLTFLIFILLVLVLLIIPSMKEYRTQKTNLKRYLTQNKHLSQKQVTLSQNIENFKVTHAKSLKVFEQDFNTTSFLKFLKKYFVDVSLDEQQTKNMQSQFKIFRIKAMTRSKTPKDFYTFIDNLAQYPAIVKINFPISLFSKTDRIALDFNISIYKQNISK